MYEKILSLLSSSAIRGQVLGDNRFHMLIVYEQLAELAEAISQLLPPTPCPPVENPDVDSDDFQCAHV